MNKFITDTEKLFDENFSKMCEMKFANGFCKIQTDDLKQFLKSKLQEAYIKGQVDIIKMSYAETLERIKKELKQQLIEKIEGLHDIGCEIQRAGRCSCPVYKIINIIKEI